MDLEKLNLVELNAQEVQETEGGIWPLIVVGCLLLASCQQNNVNVSSGTQVNVQVNAQNIGDSISNSNQGTVKLK